MSDREQRGTCPTCGSWSKSVANVDKGCSFTATVDPWHDELAQPSVEPASDQGSGAAQEPRLELPAGELRGGPVVSQMLGKYLNTMVSDLRINGKGQYLRELFSKYETEACASHQGAAPQHGRDCPKVRHLGEGYLHSADDDRPYDVEGVEYCGRCHCWMGKRVVEQGAGAVAPPVSDAPTPKAENVPGKGLTGLSASADDYPSPAGTFYGIKRITGTLEQKARQLAQRFHEAYERLAPRFGYETRKESAKPWAEVPENNRNLMIAVCLEMLREQAQARRDGEEVK